MPLRHLRRRRRKAIKLPDIHLMDKDEKFLSKNCLLYASRLLAKNHNFDYELFTLLTWLLRTNSDCLNDTILKYANSSSRKEISENLLECGNDCQESGAVLFEALKKISPLQLGNIRKKIISLLENEYKSLTYKGLSTVEKNLRSLQAMFNLRDSELKFVTFLLTLASSEKADDFFERHFSIFNYSERKTLANIIGVNKSAIPEIINGRLKEIDLFNFRHESFELTEYYLDLLQNNTTKDISRNLFSRAPTAGVPLSCHFITPEKTTYMQDILKTKPKTSSSHILLYGPPGTGKTSFALGIAGQIDAPAYLLKQDNTENETIKRRSVIIACANMTNSNQTGSIIIVDEADNLLNTKTSWFARGETQDKGWLNQFLESPGRRIIWVVNSINEIDDSVMRRFAFSVAFKPFNIRQRHFAWETIIRKNRVKRFFKRQEISNYTRKFSLNAGIIDLSVKKAKEAAADKKSFHKILDLTMESHQQLINRGRPVANKEKTEVNYSLAGLNIKSDAAALIKQLQAFDDFLKNSQDNNNANMNLLFYGPPGSGKSQLARFIASEIGREIVSKSISDIMDKYVGGTEKNIRDAFQEAERQDALLIFDEVDTIIFDREQAQRSWEISHTNEFLLQMERFRGILICTTNRLTGIDKASIRRFNHKIGFDYLTSEGSRIFYEKLLKPLTESPLNEKMMQALKRITNLTPGDFKTVRDRMRFIPAKDITHMALIEVLQEEAAIKKMNQAQAVIGF